jgi:hypothetical protein
MTTKRLAYNEVLPSKIRRALVGRAKASDVRLNDAAGEALATHFGMEWERGKSPYRVERARIDKIKVPDALHKRIRREALRIPGGTMRGVVLSILAEQLELGLTIPKTRRPRRNPERST